MHYRKIIWEGDLQRTEEWFCKTTSWSLKGTEARKPLLLILSYVETERVQAYSILDVAVMSSNWMCAVVCHEWA